MAFCKSGVHHNTTKLGTPLPFGEDRYFQIPPFRPPQFASCRLFTLGLPARIARLAPGW